MQNQRADLVSQQKGQYKTIENSTSNIHLTREKLQKSKSPPIKSDQKDHLKSGTGPGLQSSQLETDSAIIYQKYKDTSPFAAYSENGATIINHQYSHSIESGPVKSAQQLDAQSQNYDFLFDPEKGDSYSQNQSSHISSGDALIKNKSMSPNAVNGQQQSQYAQKIQKPEAQLQYETGKRLQGQYVDDSEEDPDGQQYYDEEAYDEEENISEDADIQQEMSPTNEPLSPETRHLRTIQEETDPLQERSNSVISKDKNFRSIPSEGTTENINFGEERSPQKRHQRSAPYPATQKSSQCKKKMRSNNSNNDKSFQSPITQKSEFSGQAMRPQEDDLDEMPDPFDELCNAKLSLMAEKTVNRFVMKELLAQITLINDLFYRKQVQQEMILNNESEMQLKSFVELGMSMSSNDIVLSQSLRKEILDDMKTKNSKQLSDEIRHQSAQVLKRFTDFMKVERQILNSLAKEKERNTFLENELGKREYRSVFSGEKSSIVKSTPDKNDQQQKQLIQKMEMMSMDQEEAENYINELENQLQEARQELLNTKLQISDQKVDNINLQQQVEGAEEQIRTLIENSQKFEDIFEQMQMQIQALEQEKLKQMQNNQKMKDFSDIVMNKLKQNEEIIQQHEAMAYHMHKQNDTRQAMDQVQAIINQSQIEGRTNSPMKKDEKMEMHRHIDQLNRQLVDYQKNKESLELVEQNLLQKVEKKQSENAELKNLLNEIRSQLDMKTDAISKAQKIIEKLSQKSEMDESQIGKNQEELDKLKKELSFKQQRIKDMSIQLDEVHRKQQQNVFQMNDTLNRELQELKGAIKDYQTELEVEKQKYSSQVTSLNEELDQRIFERDEWCRRVRELEIDLEKVFREKTACIRQIEEQAKAASLKSKEREDEVKTLFEQKLTEAQNQTQYLQKRLKEIVEDSSQQQRQIHLSESEQGLGLLNCALKKEFEVLGSEVIAIREALRLEQKRENVIINQKLSRFDEFKLTVLDELILWDQKAADLASIANRYYSYLEEQRKMFLKMKLIVNEKDQIIERLKKQLVVREQAHECNFNAMKGEIHVSNRIMREEMMQTIRLLEKKCEAKERSCNSLEDHLEAFKKEFTQLLDDKDFSDQQYIKMKADLQLVEQSYLNLKTGTLRQNDRLAEIMGIVEGVSQSHVVSDQSIERALKNLVQENKLNFEDNVRQREELDSLERARAEEKQIANQKLEKIEKEFQHYRSAAEQKEEQFATKFMNKENKIKQELQTAEAYAEKVSSEAQVRERQLKKIQLKREEDAKKLDDLNSTVSRLAKEKVDIFTEKERLEGKIADNQRIIEDMLNKCEQSKHLYELVQEELVQERQKVRELEDYQKDLQRSLSQEQLNVQKTQEQFDQLDTKVHALEKRSEQQQKESNDLFKQVSDSQLERDRALIQAKQLHKEIDKVNQDLAQAKSDIQFYIQEVKNFENTVLRLTKDLDEERGKDELIEELQQNLQTFDQQIDLQANQIISLQDKLRGPKKVNSMVQTEESGILELQYARQEIIKNQMISDEAFEEASQLRDALQRSNFEVCKLIEDKRELEDLIEKLNQSINFHRQNSQVNLLSQRMMASARRNTPQKSGLLSNSPNRNTLVSTGYLGNNNSSESGSDEQAHMIFHEKDNYINQLENEINQMRREIEAQRETIILLDLNSLGNETNRLGVESGLSNHVNNTGKHRQQNIFTSQNDQSINAQMANKRNPYNSYMPVTSIEDKYFQRENRNDQACNENQNPNIQSTHISSYNADSIPIRLNPQTMNYSTLSRTLTNQRDLNDTTAAYQLVQGSIAETNEEAINMKYLSQNEQFSIQNCKQDQRKLERNIGSYEGFLNPNASFQNYQSVGEQTKARPFVAYLQQ